MTMNSSLQKSTDFVEAGTALANIGSFLGIESRNVFYPTDNSDEMLIVRDGSRQEFSGNGFFGTYSAGKGSEVYRAIPENRNHASEFDCEDWVVPKPKIVVREQLTVPLAIWEGTVEKIDLETGVFHAALVCKTGVLDDHLVSIPLDQVESADMELLAVGAVFYLEHYQRNWRGGRETTQMLRFRRSFVWNNKIISWAKQRADELDNILPAYVSPEVD